MLENEPMKETDANEEFQFLEENIAPPPFYKKIKWHKILLWIMQLICVAVVVLGFLEIKEKLTKAPKEEPKAVEEEPEPRTQVIKSTTYQTIDMTPEQMDHFAREIQGFQENVKKYIVQLKTIGEGETWSSNPDKYKLVAGFWIAQTETNGYILVDGSIKDEKNSILGSFINEEVYPFELVGYDKELDIALLSIDKGILSVETRTLVESLTEWPIFYPSLGGSVYGVGNPLGYPNTFAEGIIAGKFDMTDTWDDRYQLLTLQMPISAKGSGLVMNVQGSVLGWIVPKQHQSEVYGYTNILTMRQLKEITQGLRTTKPLPYLGLQVRGMEVKEQLDNEMPIGLYIEKVAENSPALLAGIQPGDIITSMNGEINLTQESFNQLLLRDNEVETWDVVAQRMTPKGYAEIVFQVNLNPQKDNNEN